MKKATLKKLTLNRETLGALSEQDLKTILGGAMRPTTDSVNACCA